MPRVRRGLALVVALVALSLTAAAPKSLAPGAVVGLAGTPHLWIADSAGVLHWGGDTRALAGKQVNWNDRRDVSLAELQTYPIGDPWLSAGLLKDGDPIYQVKWETDWPQPQLLHIQSIKDVELFGIDGSNYGNYVLDKAAWEQRYGIDAAVLPRHPLASAVPPGVTITLNRVPGGTVVAHPSGTWISDQGIHLQMEVVAHDPDGWREMVIENGLNTPPRAGYRYLLVTVKVRNLGTTEVLRNKGMALQSGAQLFTEEASSCGANPVVPNSLSMATLAAFGTPFLPPGESVTGTVCFHIPEGVRHLALVPSSPAWATSVPAAVIGAEELPVTDHSGIERQCRCRRTRVDGGCDRRFRPLMTCLWVAR